MNYHLTKTLSRWGARSLRVAGLTGAVAAVMAWAPTALARRVLDPGNGTSETSASLAAVRLVPTDTATVISNTYATSNGSEQHIVTPFTTTPDPNLQYFVEVTKGAITVTKADVLFNRWKVATVTDLAGTGKVTRTVNALAADTIDVRIAGSSGANITVALKTVSNPTYTIRGPKRYTKDNQFQADTFTIAIPPAATPFFAYVTNGPTGTNRANSLELKLNGTSLTVPGEFGTSLPGFVIQLSLSNGQNILSAKVGGANGSAVDIRTVATDNIPPLLTISTPTPNQIANATTVNFSGTVKDSTLVWVRINGLDVFHLVAGDYSRGMDLVEGSNVFTVHAFDRAGYFTDSTRTVIRDTNAPTLNVLVPTDGLTTGDATLAVSGSVSDATAVTVSVNGTPLTVHGDNSITGTVALALGANVLSFTATDGAGNATTVVRNVTRSNTPVPPDPSTVAPALDRTVATTMFTATQFLYTGANPIQAGVSGGAIDPVRVSVLKGKVKTRAGAAIPGVEIGILDHTEYGKTYTRADGAFDIAVNGGGLVNVNYKKSGYLAVQRPIDATAQQYDVLDDVVMIAVDTAVTTVDFTAPITVHRAVAVSDSDGTRRATLLFPQGTQVTMVKADGSTQALSSINVRATEYTVGSSGLQAMPAPLPATSGYTYAAELSADEALSIGARSVQFSNPVPVYIENFLGFPVGTPVPVGAYDVLKGAWVPMSTGRIIKITSIAGGIATISVDTLGTTADSATLATLGMTTAERQSLATIYTAGQALWRMPVTHFSPIDGNYPYGPQAGSPLPASKQPNNTDNCPAVKTGSVIECTTQVVGENLAVTGAPFRLAYRSNRVPGFLSGYRQRVRLTNATLPANLQRVDVEFAIAGRKFTQTFAPSANLMTTFAWDGKDAYGRRVQGRQQLTARVGYVYPRLYYVPAKDATTFGLNCYGDPSVPADVSVCQLPQASTPLLEARRLTTLWREYQFLIGTQDLEADKQGVWSVDIHHVFDPVDRVLHLGDGRRRDAQDVLTTVAGTGAIGFTGDGGPAAQAKITDPDGLAAGPDGSVYFHDGTRHIRRIAPDGTISTIAGNGTFGYSPDGTLATQASLGTIIPNRNDIAVGPDGTIYYTEGALGIVRKIAADGTLKTVAGDRTIAFCNGDNEPEDSLAARFACVNDGGPATQASIWGPFGITVGPDGTLYIGDGNHMVRRVGPDGIITTMAGGGHASYPCDYGGNSPWGNPTICGDGGLARLAGFDVPWDFAVGPDGGLYLTDENAVIRRVGVDGIVTRIAGTSVNGFSGDGGPATSAQITFEGGIAFGPDGSLYFADFRRIRRINPAGIITTIAGDGLVSSCGQPNPPTCTSGELAAQSTISTTRRIAVGPDGSLYFGTWQGDYRVRRLTPFFRRYDATGITIASEDGSEVYEFDANGRHLRTRDALTKHVLFLFGYDGAGRLTTVTDADNNVTTLQRDGAGALTAIVSPFGKTTSLTFDARGYLATVTNPAGEVITAQHDTLGLLQTLRDAKNNPPTRFTYDSLGHLTRDSSATGSFLTLARTESDTSVSVTITSALNRTETFARILLPNGIVRRVETDQAGLTTQRNEQSNGTTVTTTPGGTVTTVTEKPDPRFGMQAPYAGSFSVALPSALTLSGSSKRSVTLSDPLDPLSMTSQLDSLTLNGRVFTSAYDAAARTRTVTSAVGRQTVTVLDTTGRVLEERVTGLAPVKYTYGARGFLTTVTQAGRLLQYDYDSSGRVKKVTDPLGRIEQFAYDSIGRVTQQTLPDGRVIAYAYDANGNLTSLTPPTKPAHTFQHTVGDQDSIYSPPAAGLSSFKTKYQYNLDRQLTQITRPDSLAIAIGYDNVGRPNGLTLPNGSMTFGYHMTSGLLNSLGSATGGSLAYTYDGSLPTLATWTGTVAGSVGYTYDNNFRVTALTVNGANAIALGYDNDNLLTSAGSLTLSRSSQNGRLTGTSLGNVATTITYDDSVGTINRSMATYSGSTILDFQYTRDTLDRITQLIENIQGTTQTWVYVYDSVGRLDQVRLNGTLISDYAYDGNGNRTGVTTQSGGITATVDDQDRLLTYGTKAYTYTNNGELTRKVDGTDTTRYDYDVLGNLLQIKLPNGTQIDYLVDGQNRRIGKKVNGVLTEGFLYQGHLAPIAELDGSNQVVSRFVFGARVNVPEYMIKAGTTYRLLTDHLGSVRLVVNTSTGTVAQRIDYDEFGRVTQNTNPGFQPYGYAGGLNDDDTKFVRFGARDYDAETGRWTAKDPLGFIRGSTLLYEYAGGNPINSSDRSGLAICRNAAGQPIPCPEPPEGPPVPPRVGPSGKPNEWINKGPAEPGRRNRWVPREGLPSGKGGQPGGSWDPSGHWDVDDGMGNRRRFRPDGTEVDHDDNPIKTPCPEGENLMDRLLDFLKQPVPEWMPTIPPFDPWNWLPLPGRVRFPIPWP